MTELSAPRSSSSRAGVIAWLVLTQLGTLASLAGWAAIVGLSVMAFDSGPDIGTLSWTLLIVLWGWPLLALGSSVWAWIAFAKRKNRQAMVLTTLPAALAAVVAVFLLS